MFITQFKYLVFLLVLLTSCNAEETNKTKVIEKNSSDEYFSIKNGVVFYVGKPYTGIINSLYKTGELKSKSEYSKGKRNGYYKGWYIEGNKSFERFYVNGFKYGSHLGWYKNGKLKFSYHFNKEGAYDGEIKEWFENGQVFKIFNFKNGKEEGSQRMWQPDGKIRANFVTKNGERFGLIGLKKCYSVNIANEIIR